MNSPQSNSHPSSAGTPGWPGCADWWIRLRCQARSCWSSARRGWARPCCWRTPPNGRGWRACGSCWSPAGNRSPGSRSPGCISSCGRYCPAPPACPSGRPMPCPGALGLSADPVAPDPLLTGAAVLTLLSDLSERSPVLVVADDVHWLDRSSLDALAFAASRLDAERVVLLAGARGQAPPRGFDRGFPELRLGPLSAADAGLPAGRPAAPAPRAGPGAGARPGGRQSHGADRTGQGDSRRSRRQPPLGRRAAAPDGPAKRRHALSLLRPARADAGCAAAGRGGRRPGPARGDRGLLRARRAEPGASRTAWPDQDRPAGLRFSHPLVRSAIYHTAPFAQRAAAHRQLASALHDQPDRRAWHLAAAALHPDEEVASLLEATATQARRRGGAAAAALAMERAAELSPDVGDQARRLVAAASAAVPTGQGEWVQDLAARALAVTADPALRLTARRDAGWALAWSGRRSAALQALISVAEEASRDQPDLAWDALGSAATVAYQSGMPASRQAVSRALGLLERQGPPPQGRARGHRCQRAETLDRRQRRPDGQQRPAPPVPAQDRRLAY